MVAYIIIAIFVVGIFVIPVIAFCIPPKKEAIIPEGDCESCGKGMGTKWDGLGMICGSCWDKYENQQADRAANFGHMEETGMLNGMKGNVGDSVEFYDLDYTTCHGVIVNIKGDLFVVRSTSHINPLVSPDLIHFAPDARLSANGDEPCFCTKKYLAGMGNFCSTECEEMYQRVDSWKEYRDDPQYQDYLASMEGERRAAQAETRYYEEGPYRGPDLDPNEEPF